MFHRPTSRGAALAGLIFVAAHPCLAGDPDDYLRRLLDSEGLQRKLDPVLRQEAIWLSQTPEEALPKPSEIRGALGAIHRHSRSAFAGTSSERPDPPLFPLVLGASGERVIPCWIRFEPGNVLPLDLDCRVLAPGLATARLPVTAVAQLAALPEVLALCAARRTEVSLNVSVAEVLADDVHDGAGSPPVYAGLTGKNILVGIVDTGVDLDHSDFRDGSGTRLVSLWDQTASPSIGPPSGFSYGREWTTAQINSSSATQEDGDGHGSHVAGIAAGNGSGTGHAEPVYQYVGMAPEAKLCVVKTDFYTSSIVDAVDYIFQRAATLGLPAVVNLSLGHHYGPHDGTEETDVALNALAGAGKLIVAAAGNEQEDSIHGERAIAVGDSAVITLLVDGSAPSAGAGNDYALIDGYYDQSAILEITVRTPNGHRVGPLTPGSKTDINTADGGVYLENDYFDPATADVNFFLQVYDKLAANPPVSGEWRIVFRNVSTSATEVSHQVDLWLYTTSLTEAVINQGMTSAKLVASPATADSVVAVAAFVTKLSWTSESGSGWTYVGQTLGDLATFSSRGPRRDGVLKPDIAAPGMGIGSVRSADASVSATYILQDGVHWISAGTSMAAPHVAGLGALMQQAHGSLSKQRFLEKLASSARGDAYASGLPTAEWGYGKIDAVGGTTVVTPLGLQDLQFASTPLGVRITWSVPSDAATTEFRVWRQDGGARERSIGETGPGPLYSVLDPGPISSEGVIYWLDAVGTDGTFLRHGPYQQDVRIQPTARALGDLHPNPTTGEVVGSLTIWGTEPIRIEVIDAIGRLVRLVHEGPLMIGEHSIRWDGETADGRPAASGCYWIRVRGFGLSDSRRMVLLRAE